MATRFLVQVSEIEYEHEISKTNTTHLNRGLPRRGINLVAQDFEFVDGVVYAMAAGWHWLASGFSMVTSLHLHH